jgi:hypothetical protein
MRDAVPQANSPRLGSQNLTRIIPLVAAVFVASGCSSNEPTPTAAPAAPTAPAAPDAAAPAPATEVKDPEGDRGAAREQRRIDRRGQRKVDFENQAKVFEYPVLASTPDAATLRAKILEVVQPVAGVALQWTLRSCVAETLWDSADGTLKTQGAVLISQASLETDTCKASGRSRSSLLASHLSTDATAVRSTHQKLVAMTTENAQMKVMVESATTVPEAAPAVVVRAQERHKGVLSSVDTKNGLGKVMVDRFWAAGSEANLTVVCGEARTVRNWVLEEKEALPAKDKAAPKTDKRGKARKARERHRSWARLTVATDAADKGTPHASFYMREASKRESDAGRLQLPTTTYTGLKAAGMVVEIPLIDAQYRCGG